MHKVTIIEHVPFDGSTTGYIKIKFENYHYKLINAIRRIANKYVTTWAYPQDKIKIEANTNVAYNNDMMRLRLSYLPIFDTGKLYNNTTKSIMSYINVTNNTNSIINVTSHNIICKIDNENSDMYKKVDEILIIKLLPQTKFICTMTGQLGMGITSDIWSASQNGYYDYSEDMKTINLTLETDGKMNLMEILTKTMIKLDEKINKIRDQILAELEKKPDNDIILFEIDNEDYSICDVINNEFQEHNKITQSGVSRPDMLKNTSVIKITNDKNLSVSIKDCFNNIVKQIDDIRNQLKNNQKKKH